MRQTHFSNCALLSDTLRFQTRISSHTIPIGKISMMIKPTYAIHSSNFSKAALMRQKRLHEVGRLAKKKDSRITKVAITVWNSVYIILSAAAIFSVLLYLFKPSSGHNIYSKSLKLIEEDTRIKSILGCPLKTECGDSYCHRTRVYSQRYRGKDNLKRSYAKYLIRGPKRSGVVLVQMVKDGWWGKFEELLVECKVKGKKKHIVIYQNKQRFM